MASCVVPAPGAEVFADAYNLDAPYLKWHHTHRFNDVEGGTAVTDEVLYRAPGGRWVDRLIVQRDVYTISAYRAEQVRKIVAPVGEPLNARGGDHHDQSV